MARKKKGRPLNGWIVIDKPAGMTSTTVVNKVKWALDAQKAGHAGTLDPAATGVLAVALGEATKTVPFITDALKAYRFTVKWGEATNTADAEGEVIETSESRPSEDAFSAVKIDGVRAYKKARDGEEVELEARPLWVEELTLLECSEDTAELELVCGKGGYVRAIARDLGRALGCLGHVLTLRRTWSGPFEVENALTWETLEANARTEALDSWLQPVEIGLADLPELRTTIEGATRLRNGNPGFIYPGDAEYGDEAWASLDGRAVAVGIVKGGELHPSRVFVG